MKNALRIAAAWVALCGASSQAQHWTDNLFPESAHEFGTVARGSKLLYQFRLVNTTNYEIHIADARPKCGCTNVQIGARTIPPGTQTVIEATLDTTRFNGFKASGLTLVMDRPAFAEKDLNLNCFIRGDVLLNPGGVEFGVVRRGSAPATTLTLNYLGGNQRWGVTKVTTDSNNLTAHLERFVTQTGGVQYQITAKLAETAPVGSFKDQITLHTNDPSSPAIPISVSGQVQAAVTVAPGILNLGAVKAGQVVTRDVLVRSSKPFKIVSATSKKPELSAGTGAGTGADASKAVHKVTVTLKAPDQAGPFNAVLEIGTDLKDEPPALLSTFATVVR